MLSYLKRAAADNVQYAEFFKLTLGEELLLKLSSLRFIELLWMVGYGWALRTYHYEFLHHLSEDEALKILEEARPYLAIIVAIDLDSGEQGNPPNKFSGVFKQATGLGLELTVHAGEKGGPDYIVQALDQKVLCINHGIRCLEDDGVIQWLKEDEIPLTVVHCQIGSYKVLIITSRGRM